MAKPSTHVSRDRRTHGHCSHPISTVAASIGREKWTCYLEQNLSTSRIPRGFRPSMSHACDYQYVLLCNDMYCVDMGPMDENGMRRHICFSAALADDNSGKLILKFCTLPGHSGHPCNPRRAVEHPRHRMSMIIKKFAFSCTRSPKSSQRLRFGPFFSSLTTVFLSHTWESTI